MKKMQPDAKPGAGDEPLDVEGAAGLPHGAKKVAFFFLKYVLGISLIVWMVWTGKVDLSVLRDLRRTCLLEALALTMLIAVLGAVRVRYVLARQGIATGLCNASSTTARASFIRRSCRAASRATLCAPTSS
jgi:hypothetical protein